MLSGCFLVVDKKQIVLISCNFFQMLVQGVKHREGGGEGGGGGGRRARRRLLLVKGKWSKVHRGFPLHQYV